MRGGVGRRTFAAWVIIALLPGWAVGQQGARNAVPISIYWSKAAGRAPLAGVAFQDENRGSIPFSRAGDHFSGTRVAAGSWAFHDVVLSYGSDEAPLALRTRAGVPGIRIDVALPTFVACRREKLTELRSVPRNAPIQTRINTMLGARHLLALRASVCPVWAQRDLAEIYFVMSCSLATQTSFFRVSDEAKENFRKLARNAESAEAEIANCDRQALGTAVKALHAESRSTLAKGDFGSFEALNAELMSKAGEPGWSGAFAAQDLDATLLRADLLKAIYDQQQASAARGEYSKALQYNGRLTALLADLDFAPAFREVSLDSGRLGRDREYFESLLAGQQVPPGQ